MGTGSFSGVKCGRVVLLTTHPLLLPRSWKSRAIPLPTLWATQGLQRENFTFTSVSKIVANKMAFTKKNYYLTLHKRNGEWFLKQLEKVLAVKCIYLCVDQLQRTGAASSVSPVNSHSSYFPSLCKPKNSLPLGHILGQLNGFEKCT